MANGPATGLGHGDIRQADRGEFRPERGNGDVRQELADLLQAGRARRDDARPTLPLPDGAKVIEHLPVKRLAS